MLTDKKYSAKQLCAAHARGPQGARGPRGFPGTQGPRGPKGSRGPSGLSGLEVVIAATPPLDVGSNAITARCPVGKIAVGGGGEVTAGRQVVMDGSFPSVSGNGKPIGWTVTGSTIDGRGFTWSVTAYCICVNDPTAGSGSSKRTGRGK